MTGNDYELVAGIVRVMPKGQRDYTARHFAERFKNASIRFNAEKFLQACCVSQQDDDE